MFTTTSRRNSTIRAHACRDTTSHGGRSAKEGVAGERGDLEATLAPDADREALREFVERAEAGEFDADPGLEATVRIVRGLLDGDPDD